MVEDAACEFPCGEEPFGCIRCPDRGRTAQPNGKDYYLDMLEIAEENGVDIDDPMYGDMWEQM